MSSLVDGEEGRGGEGTGEEGRGRDGREGGSASPSQERRGASGIYLRATFYAFLVIFCQKLFLGEVFFLPSPPAAPGMEEG